MPDSDCPATPKPSSFDSPSLRTDQPSYGAIILLFCVISTHDRSEHSVVSGLDQCRLPSPGILLLSSILPFMFLLSRHLLLLLHPSWPRVPGIGEGGAKSVEGGRARVRVGNA